MDSAIFKEIVTEVLPEALVVQLEPYLEILSRAYDEAEYSQAQAAEVEFHRDQSRRRRLDDILVEFDKENAPKWPAFARARWPEVDQFFDLEPTGRIGDVDC